MNIKYNTYGVLLLVFASLVLPCGVSAQTPPPSCLAYAFTYEEELRHLSLIERESVVFGNRITLTTDCGQGVDLIIDDVSVLWTNRSAVYEVTNGLHNISIQGEGFSAYYQNVTFVQAGQLGLAMGNLPANHNPDAFMITPADLGGRQMLVALSTGLITWAVVTMGLWHIINSYVDRNYIEEVK